MDFPEARKFLTASFHDLPNVLFMGSLILGSVMGYLPLIWIALGMILNGSVVAALQLVVKWLVENIEFFKNKSAWFQGGTEYAKCFVGYQRTAEGLSNFIGTPGGKTIIAPSHWMAASSFFAIFSIYNSIRVAIREPKGKVDQKLKDTRRALTISTAIIGGCFFALLFARFYFQCETWVGGVLGILVGFGMAIAYWHILDSCGTGKLPDVLQVVGSMAPEQGKKEQPVMCTAPIQ
jgi:hypothetical protein